MTDYIEHTISLKTAIKIGIGVGIGVQVFAELNGASKALARSLKKKEGVK